jgi:hypothetical protein
MLKRDNVLLLKDKKKEYEEEIFGEEYCEVLEETRNEQNTCCAQFIFFNLT